MTLSETLSPLQGFGTRSTPFRSPDMMENPKNRAFDKQPKSDQDVSPAGPHDKPKLTDPHKTPGTGMLQDSESKEVEGPTG
jgi:hypothetical protein